MKRIKILIGTLFISGLIIGQQNPAGTQGTSLDWKRGGNVLGGGNPANANIFGTMWNSPIHTYTNGQQRMIINGNTTNQFGQNTDGYVGIGRFTGTSPIMNQNDGPWTLLHLEGGNNTPFTGNYRNWMKTGILIQENSDGMYVGLQQRQGLNRSDAVVVWSDDPIGGSGGGVDKLRFIFTATSLSPTGGGTGGNPRNGASFGGYEFMRMQPVNSILNSANFSVGHIGIGPLFTDNDIPRSRLHIHAEDSLRTFIQITNQIGTGQNDADGLRVGISRRTPQPAYYAGDNRHYAYFRWQENSAMIFQTDWNIPAGGTEQGERMRISAVGSLIADPNYFGPNTDLNRTRIAISHRGDQPLVRPMASLHIGSDLFNSALTGWRDWMDIGTLYSKGSDNMYIGLRDRGAGFDFSQDAIINWGISNDTTPNIQFTPDRLRFVFTARQDFLLDTIAASNDGREVMRISPIYDTLNQWGRVGIGNFFTNGLNEEPTHKLDVEGNGRFRFLPDSIYMADTNVTQYVMVDSMGVLRWTSSSGQIGQACGDSLNPAKLTSNREIPMNKYNVYFSGQDSIYQNAVGIGIDCGTLLPAKLTVLEAVRHHVPDRTIAGGFRNVDTSLVIGNTIIGVYGESLGLQYQPRVTNIGGDFRANFADINIGVRTNMPNQVGVQSVGGQFLVTSSNVQLTTGVEIRAFNGSIENTGIRIDARDQNNIAQRNIGVNSSANQGTISATGVYGVGSGGATSYGVRGSASGGTINYGVYGELPAGNLGYAGYFDGNVFTTGSYLPSDINMKTNIQNYDSSLFIINLLQPKTFEYSDVNFQGMNLPTGHQYGLIAQEVEQILPSIVSNNTHPAQYDSLGNQITPAYNFKGVKYEALIPVLLGGIKEQQTKIEEQDSTIQVLESNVGTQDSIINDLNTRLTTLENCLSGILPFLCQLSNSSIQQNDEQTQQNIIKELKVQLDNSQSIVLGQNVPNPFAEQTVIEYFIPEAVKQAQIIFYNQTGQIINTVNIEEMGNGRLTVFANDLSSGIYTYTLVADGQVIATKKMVKTK